MPPNTATGFRTEQSRQLYQRAAKVLIEGGSSPSRGPVNYGEYPIFMQRGQGSRLYDVDGNEYIDWMMVIPPASGYLEALQELTRRHEILFILDETVTGFRIALGALVDGILAWRKQKKNLQQFLREAATPGGVAEATMAGMEQCGYGKAVRHGLQAGLARARALGWR